MVKQYSTMIGCVLRTLSEWLLRKFTGQCFAVLHTI
nr:MAG TPA: hypothetical protein [Caudoviricetes sp.]